MDRREGRRGARGLERLTRVEVNDPHGFVADRDGYPKGVGGGVTHLEPLLVVVELRDGRDEGEGPARGLACSQGGA